MNQASKTNACQQGAAATRSNPGTTPSVKRDWIFGLVLVLAVFFVYQPARHAGFIWDDDIYVTGNIALRSLHGLRLIWFVPDATVQYYPLTFTAFWLEYHLWGLDPLGYHLVNILLHSVNAILFWMILKRLGVPGAWLAAGIFALHPVCVETVMWVTEHKNTLSGVFYLGSLLAALKFWLPGETSLQSKPLTATGEITKPSDDWRFYWLAVAFYLCALWSKTAAVPLPAVILLLVWWKRGRMAWREVQLILPFLAVGIVMGFITMQVETHRGATGNEWDLSLLERCLVAGKDFWFYLGKLFWPHPLIFVYPRWEINPSQASSYLPILAAAIGLLILWSKRNGWGRPILFALAYFVILLSLVLGFIKVFYFRYSFVSDHFQYLASLGPITLAAAGIVWLADLFKRPMPWLKAASCAGLLLALGTLSWRQALVYQSVETLWTDTLQKNPNCSMAHNNLGNALLQKGDVDEAIVHFQKALQIKPDNAEAAYSLGNALIKMGSVDEAIGYYQKALQIRPDYVDADNKLGSALFTKGSVAEAIGCYQKALQIKPNNVEALNLLAFVLASGPQASLRNGNKAVELAQRANHLTGDRNPALLGILAAAYAEAGRFPEAVETAQRALQLAESQSNFALANAIQSQLELYQAGTPFHFPRSNSSPPN
jgi:tetratricopeptide (TPR) repeat protein